MVPKAFLTRLGRLLRWSTPYSLYILIIAQSALQDYCLGSGRYSPPPVRPSCLCALLSPPAGAATGTARGGAWRLVDRRPPTRHVARIRSEPLGSVRSRSDPFGAARIRSGPLGTDAVSTSRMVYSVLADSRLARLGPFDSGGLWLCWLFAQACRLAGQLLPMVGDSD